VKSVSKASSLRSRLPNCREGEGGQEGPTSTVAVHGAPLQIRGRSFRGVMIKVQGGALMTATWRSFRGVTIKVPLSRELQGP